MTLGMGKLIRDLFLVVLFLSVFLFIFTMSILKLFGGCWSVFNPIGNPFCVLIPMIVLLILPFNLNYKFIRKYYFKRGEP